MKISKNKIFKNTLLLMVFLCWSDKVFSYTSENMDVQPYIGVSETYNDNIAFTKDNQQDDVITSIDAGLTAKYTISNNTVEVSGNISQEIFAKQDNFNNLSGNLAIDSKNELSKFDRINLTESFTHTQEPLSPAESLGRTIGRYNHNINNFALEYLKEITKQTTIALKYANESDWLEKASDSSLHKAGVKTEYSLSSSTIPFLLYEYSLRDFFPGDKAEDNRLAIGTRQFLTQQLYCDLTSGFDFINAYSGATYAKPFFSASIIDNITNNTNIGLSFVQEYTTTPYMEDILDNWKISASLEQQLLQNLSCALSSFYGQGTFIALSIRDKFTGHNASLSYYLNKQTKLSLSYTFSRANSSLDTREYIVNTTLMKLTVEF